MTARDSEKRALAIRHVHFEDCGTLGDLLLERGFHIEYIEAARTSLLEIDVTTPDLLIGRVDTSRHGTRLGLQSRSVFETWLNEMKL